MTVRPSVARVVGRAVGRVLGPGLIVAGLVAVVAPPASAADVDAVGWWQQEAGDPISGGLGELEEGFFGPEVGEGQLLIEGAADGATAVAAARWRLGEREVAPSLVLSVVEGSSIDGESVVLACASDGSWSAPDSSPGAWDDKPVVDPTRCTPGLLAADGASISFALQALARDGLLDVVFVPGRERGGEEGSDGSEFRWVTDAPAGNSLSVTIADPPPPSTTAAPTTTAPPPPTTIRIGAPIRPPVTSPPATVAPAPRPTIAPAPAPVVAAPALPDDALTSPVGAAGDDGTSANAVGFALLAAGALAAGWAYVSRDDEEDGMIGLGRFRRPLDSSDAGPIVTAGPAAQPDDVGGLGRFARKRTEPPVPLQ